MQFPVIGPFANSLGSSPALVGIIVAAYSFTNLIGNLAAGVILDRWGRNLPIQIGLLFTAISLFGYVISTSPEQLLIARCIHGLSASMLAPGAFAIIGDSSLEKSRVKVMGRSSAPIAGAALVGPMISAFLGRAAGYPTVFATSAVIMLIVLIVFFISSRTERIAIPNKSANDRLSAGYGQLSYLRLSIAYLAALSLTIGLGALVTHLPTSLIAQGQPSSASGPPFTAFAVIATLIMASPAASFANHYGRLTPIAIGLGLISGGLLFLSIMSGMSGAIIGMVIFGSGFGILFPTMTTLVTEATSPMNRGRAFGVFYAVYSLGVVIGSGVSGMLADAYGEISGTPFLLGATATLTIAVFTIAIGRLQPHVLQNKK
jgi:DHA1 family multidrug resistance protein-like MFS transporter